MANVGRPALPKGEARSATVTVRIKPAAALGLAKFAASWGCTSSDVVRAILAEALTDQEFLARVRPQRVSKQVRDRLSDT